MTTAPATENRSEPRYQRLLPVRVDHGEFITANVSLNGMQIVCPMMRFHGLKERVRQGTLDASVTLPEGQAIGAALSVRYCSQYGDEVLIGVRLTIADPAMAASWAAYIGALADGPRGLSRPDSGNGKGSRTR